MYSGGIFSKINTCHILIHFKVHFTSNLLAETCQFDPLGSSRKIGRLTFVPKTRKGPGYNSSELGLQSIYACTGTYACRRSSTLYRSTYTRLHGPWSFRSVLTGYHVHVNQFFFAHALCMMRVLTAKWDLRALLIISDNPPRTISHVSTLEFWTDLKDWMDENG